MMSHFMSQYTEFLHIYILSNQINIRCSLNLLLDKNKGNNMWRLNPSSFGKMGNGSVLTPCEISTDRMTQYCDQKGLETWHFVYIVYTQYIEIVSECSRYQCHRLCHMYYTWSCVIINIKQCDDCCWNNLPFLWISNR